MHGLVPSEDVRRLDLVEGEPPDLMDLVDQEAELLAGARFDQQDARAAIEGSLDEPQAAPQVDAP